MFNAKTLIAVLFSLLMGLLAVKAYSVFNQSSPPETPAKEIVQKKPENDSVSEKKEPAGYSQSIPKGKRIVSIKVDEVTGVSRGLRKEDRVDVISVSNVSQTGGGKVARAVLQNVTVFDVEESFHKKQITDKVMKKKKQWTIQLLVSLDQAVILSTVDESAVLRLVLRNPEDEALETAKPVVFIPNKGIVPQQGTGAGISSLIQPGMRAISLPVQNSDGICGRLNTGDRVDVIVSFKLARFATDEGNQAEGTSGKVTRHTKSSKIILQNVMVVSTDQPVNPLTGEQKKVSMVSLMVTPHQAEKIAVLKDASKSSQIRLILRNPGDNGLVRTRGELFTDQVLAEKRSFKVIDTVKGTKTYPRKYYDQ